MSNKEPTTVKVMNLAGEAALRASDEVLRCKFVLIDWAGEIHLVFGPLAQYRYHANLVERFCTRYAIPSGWEHRPDVYALYTKEARLRGGGYLVINGQDRQVEVSGRSTSYGAFDRKRFATVVAAGGFFPGWEVLIR